MADAKNINILDAISTFDNYHTSVICTYGADLAFYEQGILNRFWQTNCRNNLIFMDADRYQETISDAGDALGFIGRRYLVVPIKVGQLQAFHSKIILLLGSDRARLLVGSGNLTFHGYGDNLEVFIQSDWTSESRETQGIFSDAWNLIFAAQKRWGHFEQADLMLEKANQQSPWLHESGQKPNSRLISSLNAPLLEQLSEYVGEQEIEKITILSPFLDLKAKAIQNIYQKFKPRRINLVLQNNKTCGDVRALNQLRKSGVPVNFYSFDEPYRYAHAKIYAFEGKDETTLAIGSANCTQAGLLADSATGNLETLLLHCYSSREKLDRLLAGFVGSRQINLIDSLTLRPSIPMDIEEKKPIDFQEIVLDGQTIGVRFFAHLLPGRIANLALIFSLQKDLVIMLDGYCTGDNSLRIALVDQDAHLIAYGVCAVAIYGLDARTKKYIRLSHPLWLTNIGELNRIPMFLTLNDERSGRLLSEMYLESDEDWRDLYNTLTTLIEFEIEKVRSIRLESDAVRKNTDPIRAETTERESVLRVVERPDADDNSSVYPEEVATIQEGALSSWLKIVFSKFPVERHSEMGSVEPARPDRPPRHKPYLTTGERFIKLARRYIRSLRNTEFNQKTPPHHFISYFSIFNKIVWLLYQHGVIEKSKLVQFVGDIHAGFFGSPQDNLVPFTAVELRNHLTWRYDPYWKDSLAYLYGLAGLVAIEDQLPDNADLFVQALTCVMAFVKPAEIFADQTGLAQVAASYNMPQRFLVAKLTQIMADFLPSAQDRLDTWSTATLLMLKDLEGDELRTHQTALVSMGIASERIAEYLNHPEQQIAFCADLVFWADRLDNSALGRTYQDKLVELYKKKGDLRSAVHALIEKGNEYRSNGDFAESVKTLMQARSLAKELNEDSLLRHVDIFLSVARFLQ
ncbi:MAG TPA: hypothetical protein PLN86_16700 [Candidatus Hydrogenedentes bacterium]|nr:hypothetical protein [Candidatus Hydrogenedentota bacterium]